MLYLILFIIFGALGSALAASKGRNQVIWFILSFLFPLISLLVLACLPSRKTSDIASELANTQLCPACAERIKVQARICRYCGHNLEQQTLAKPLEQTEASADTDESCLPAPEKEEAEPLVGPAERRISLIYEGAKILSARAFFHLEVNGERVLENCNYREAFESEMLSNTNDLDIKIVNAKSGIMLGKNKFTVNLEPDQHNVLLRFDNVWGKWLEPKAL